MNILLEIFGGSKDLNVLQMCSRSIVVFIVAWLLIRLSGRRSFGQKKPLDNIIVILLGAILSRAVAGASPFVPTIAASFVFVLLHRLCAWISGRNRKFSRLVNGEKIVVYRNGAFHKANLDRALIHKDDVLEQVRLKANIDDMGKVEMVYMERCGELSTVKKEA